jgi:hypothetical protein
MAVMAAGATPVRVHVPDAPASWNNFFERALAADPTARPASASDFRSEFLQALQAQPI